MGAFNLTLQGMQAFGVVPAFVNMDEPLLSGRSSPCSQPDSKTVSSVVAWMHAAVFAVPSIQINEIEPYPFFSADELELACFSATAKSCRSSSGRGF